MKLRFTQNTSQKTKLSQTMQSWLPILQSDLESLKETLDNATKENPFVHVTSGSEVNLPAKSKKLKREEYVKNAVTDELEAMNSYKDTLYDKLNKSLNYSLFPTKLSQDIADEVINNINENGYFDADVEQVAKNLGVDVDTFESVRKRFAYLYEPTLSGVGAVDMFESFLFQLNDFDLDDDLYRVCVKIINNFENLSDYKSEENFNDAMKVIRKLKNPPAINYLEDRFQVIPDIFILEDDEGLKVSLNDAYYPEIVIDCGGIDEDFDFVKKKVKDAKLLIDALDLRKATLSKVALMLIEYQYEFFTGGAIKPMKLDDLASELDRHHSTISRAISNKYLSCSRGVFPIKQFFATSLGGDSDTSNAEIKDYLSELIKNEDRKKPLSDNKIVALVEKKFEIKIGRRTITKYRLQLNIQSSTQRKKLYLLDV